MAFKRAQITVSPILYEQDTNGDYLLDTNNNKIVQNDDPNQISPSSDYSVTIIIQEN
jgi:hypothetical protein